MQAPVVGQFEVAGFWSSRATISATVQTRSASPAAIFGGQNDDAPRPLPWQDDLGAPLRERTVVTYESLAAPEKGEGAGKTGPQRGLSAWESNDVT